MGDKHLQTGRILPVVVSKNLIFGTRGSYKADRGITI